MPDFLYNLDYAVSHFEKTFEIKSAQREIKPEMVLRSTRNAHLILIESKSGKHLTKDQLERYTAIDGPTVEEISGQNRIAFEHDVIYNGPSSFVENHKTQMIAYEGVHPLVSVSENELRLYYNTFNFDALNHALKDGVSFQSAQITTRIPCSGECALYKIAKQVVLRLIQFFVKGEEFLDVDTLCKDVYRIGWTFADDNEKISLRNRVVKVLKLGSEAKYLGDIYMLDHNGVRFRRDKFDKAKGIASTSFLPRQRDKGQKLVSDIKAAHLK